MLKKTLCLLLALVLTLGLFAGCGSTPAAPAADGTADKGSRENKYAVLESMLDKGDYDSALQWIIQKKAEENAANTSSEDAEYVASIAGTYSLALPFDVDENAPREITIGTDCTISYNGETYGFEVETYPTDQRVLSWRTANEYPTISIVVTDKGYTSFGLNLSGINNGWTMTYRLESTFAADAQAALNAIAGDFLKMDHYSTDFETIAIHEDWTCEIDGVTYPMAYSYDSWNEAFTFYIIGLSRWDNNYTYFAVNTAENGLSCILDCFYPAAQFEQIEVTAENFWDYFEWSEPMCFRVNRDAFGDVSSLEFGRFLALKPEYSGRYVKSFSTVAVALDYQEHVYNDTLLTWNSNDGTVTWTDGRRSTSSWDMEQEQKILSYFGGVTLPDGETALYYLDRVSLSFDANTMTVDENGVYSVTTWNYSGGLYSDTLEITRCETTLILRAE